MKLHVALLLITLIAFVKFQNSVARNSENGLDLYLDFMLKNQNEDDNVIIGNNIKDRKQVNGKTTIHYGGQDYVKYWNKYESPVYTDHHTRHKLNNDNGNRNHYGRTGYVSNPDFVYEPIKTPNSGVTVTRANPNRYRGVGDNRNTNIHQYHDNREGSWRNNDFQYEPIKTPNSGVTVTRANPNRYRGVGDNRNTNIHQYHDNREGSWRNNDFQYEPIKTPNSGVTVTRANPNRYRGVEHNRDTNIPQGGKYNWHNNDNLYLT